MASGKMAQLIQGCLGLPGPGKDHKAFLSGWFGRLYFLKDADMGFGLADIYSLGDLGISIVPSGYPFDFIFLTGYYYSHSLWNSIAGENFVF